MQPTDRTGDERYTLTAGIMLRKTLSLSYRLLVITAVTCIAVIAVVSLPGTSRLMRLIMATNVLLLAWSNRRAVLEAGRFRTMLADERLAGERATLLSTIWADRTSLGAALATFVYAMSAAIQATAS